MDDTDEKDESSPIPMMGCLLLWFSSFFVVNGLSEIRPKIAVIGGGWAGFSVAECLASTADVSLWDASPTGPGGLAGAGWTTPKLKQPLEAGIHGFWREYRNTYAMLDRIGVSTEAILTPYLPSALVSASGPVAIAPVLGDGVVSSRNHSKMKGDNLWNDIASQLPPPLDVALLAEYDESSKITLADRISALGLLFAWLDFGQEDDASWRKYDQISAEQLFRDIAKVSPTLYREMVVPLLHVLPMTTGYDCSAAAALSCFHVFALQSKGAFDVRWCQGSIADNIFLPWAQRLKAGGVEIRGSCRLTQLQRDSNDDGIVVTINEAEERKFDAVVLAIGSTAAKRIAPRCPPLQSLPWTEWKRGITCVAVRMFLNRSKLPSEFLTKLQTRPEVTVCGPKIIQPQLVETGFCVYDLSRLQKAAFDDSFLVLELDFFRANSIMKLEDHAIVDLALASAEKVVTGVDQRLLKREFVSDAGVVRAKDAVSHFSIGAARSSPDIRVEKGIYMCGDWIDRRGHASWSTEKAVVTGVQAARELALDFNLSQQDMPPIISSSVDSGDLETIRKSVASIRNMLQRREPGSP